LSSSQPGKGRKAFARQGPVLQFGLRARVFQRLLQRFGFGLGQTFLDGLGRAVEDVP
jgi:hypothetical protein